MASALSGPFWVGLRVAHPRYAFVISYILVRCMHFCISALVNCTFSSSAKSLFTKTRTGRARLAKSKGTSYDPRQFHPVDGDQHSLRGRCVWGHDDRAVRRCRLTPHTTPRSRSPQPHRFTRPREPVDRHRLKRMRELPQSAPAFVLPPWQPTARS